MNFGIWASFKSFERKGSRWKPYNQLPGNSAGSLVFVAVPKTRIFGQSLASSSHNSQPTGNIWNERRTVISSLGAQDTDTRGYELSHLEDLEFSWEDPALDMDSVYRPGIDTPFSPSTYDVFQMEVSTAANLIIVDDEEDEENSAPTTSTSESERRTELPRLLRNLPFGTRLENVPDSVYRTLFR